MYNKHRNYAKNCNLAFETKEKLDKQTLLTYKHTRYNINVIKK